MARVLIKKLNPEVELPLYKTSGASGMDLMAFVEKPIKISPNSSYLVPTGLSMAFSEGYEVQIRPRSGLAAKKKLIEKNCDWIIANDVSNKSIGFDSDFNEVSIFYKDEKINDEKISIKKKSAISDEIINRVIEQLN